MKKELEVGFAVWCGLVIGVALGLIGMWVDWPGGKLPEWTNSFYSGWAQTIGSLLAIYAAYRIGQNQIKSDARLRAEDRHDEELVAMHLTGDAVSRAWAVTSKLSERSDLEVREDLRASALQQLEEAMRELERARHMRMHVAQRIGIRQSLEPIRTFLELQRRYMRPLSEARFDTLRALHGRIDAEKRNWDLLIEEFDGLGPDVEQQEPA